MEYKRTAIDTSKHVFTLHAVDSTDVVSRAAILIGGNWNRFSESSRRPKWFWRPAGVSHHWDRRLSWRFDVAFLFGQVRGTRLGQRSSRRANRLDT
jgi:hypothetical protein